MFRIIYRLSPGEAPPSLGSDTGEIALTRDAAKQNDIGSIIGWESCVDASVGGGKIPSVGSADLSGVEGFFVNRDRPSAEPAERRSAPSTDLNDVKRTDNHIDLWQSAADLVRPGVGYVAIGNSTEWGFTEFQKLLDLATGVAADAADNLPGRSGGSDINEASARCPIIAVEPPAGCTVRDIWQLLERYDHRLLRIALSADAVGDYGQRPEHVVPVLNLRIGLIRVRDASEMTLGYARRLAGIGFGGWIVVDPPLHDTTGNSAADRFDRAKAIASAIAAAV